MKKLIMMSVFVLGSMTSFADNGEKNFTLEKLNVITVKNTSTADSQEFFNHTAYYTIVARIFVCGSGNIGTDWFETVIPQTNCLDTTQLATAITTYEYLYNTVYYPDSCRVEITAHKIDDCIHP